MKLKITPPPYSRTDLLKEVKREVKMRLRVWKIADRENMRFLNPEHQHQFDKMIQLGCIISEMTDSEYVAFHQRFIKKRALKEQMKKPKDLFST